MKLKSKSSPILLALVTSIILIFGQTIDHEFVNYDDDVYIVNNPHVNSGLNRDNMYWAFTDAYSANWHPLTWISHMADIEFFGFNPAGHHLVNTIIHVMNSVLVFLIFQNLTGSVWKPAGLAFLFAVHPLHVEPVAWASQRKEVLSFSFGSISIWGYVLYSRKLFLKTKLFYFLIALFSFIMALMAKPMWISLPLILLLIDFWPLKRLNKKHFLFIFLRNSHFFLFR